MTVISKMHAHLNFSHASAADHRVSDPKRVEQLVRAALKNVAGSNAAINKHFKVGERFQPQPVPIKPQQLYSGWGNT